MTDPSASDAGRMAAVVSRAWCQALNLDALPSDANFFLLGGDSLTAVMAAADIGEELGVEIGLADLLEAPAFGEFVERVRATAAAGAV
jgi:acyl carrier protein